MKGINSIFLKFDNGEIWKVLKLTIAASRAKYYESIDEGCFQTEFDYAMNNLDELESWMYENMNWEDLDAEFVSTVRDPNMYKNFYNTKISEDINMFFDNR